MVHKGGVDNGKAGESLFVHPLTGAGLEYGKVPSRPFPLKENDVPLLYLPLAAIDASCTIEIVPEPYVGTTTE